MGIYVAQLSRLRDSIGSYQNGDLALSALQGAIDSARDQVVSVDESDTRLFLNEVEARLELLAFTADDDMIFESSLPIVDKLAIWVDDYLRGNDSALRRDQGDLNWP